MLSIRTDKRDLDSLKFFVFPPIRIKRLPLVTKQHCRLTLSVDHLSVISSPYSDSILVQ